MGQSAEVGPGLKAGGGTRGDRVGALKDLTRMVVRAKLDWTLQQRKDPVRLARKLLNVELAEQIEISEGAVVRAAEQRARAAVAGRPTFGVRGVSA